MGRGSRHFPTKGARQWAGDSARSQAQGQDPVQGSSEQPPPLTAARGAPGDGGGRSPRCLPWGQRPARMGVPGAQPRPEPSSHRAPAAFHPGPDISACRAFGKQHFNALAVKAVENVRGLVQEDSREPATPWVCRALAEPCQGSWDGVGSCGPPRLSETPLQSQPAWLLNIIYAYPGYFCSRGEAGAACPRWVLQGCHLTLPGRCHRCLLSFSLPSSHSNSRLKAEGLLGHLFSSVLWGFFNNCPLEKWAE